jgi:hypothetical protein
VSLLRAAEKRYDVAAVIDECMSAAMWS